MLKAIQMFAHSVSLVGELPHTIRACVRAAQHQTVLLVSLMVHTVTSALSAIPPTLFGTASAGSPVPLTRTVAVSLRTISATKMLGLAPTAQVTHNAN